MVKRLAKTVLLAAFVLLLSPLSGAFGCSSTGAGTCSDAPVPAAGGDCSVPGSYVVTTRPRCGSTCIADDHVEESITVLVSCIDGTCTIKGTSSDNRQSISLSCSLVGCACKSGGGNFAFTRSGFVGEGVGSVLAEGGSCTRREEYTGDKR